MRETYAEYWARREGFAALQPLVDFAMVEVTAVWDAHHATTWPPTLAFYAMRLLIAQLRERGWLAFPDDEL